MTENREKVINLLFKTLKETEYYEDIQYHRVENLGQKYDPTADEYINVYFKGNRKEKRINITADSGIAIIEDVLRGLKN